MVSHVWTNDVTTALRCVHTHSCTARAYLDFHGVPYRVLDVNPITKAGLHNHPAVKVAVERGLKYSSVPVAVLPATDPISGSLEIINHLEALGAATTARTAQAEESIEWAYVHATRTANEVVALAWRALVRRRFAREQRG